MKQINKASQAQVSADGVTPAPGNAVAHRTGSGPAAASPHSAARSSVLAATLVMTITACGGDEAAAPAGDAGTAAPMPAVENATPAQEPAAGKLAAILAA